jgi:hypothetical protein
MHIVIPTAFRGWDGQHTLKKLAPILGANFLLTIVCPRAERKEYGGYNVTVRPESAAGIGPTRQWIMDTFKTDKIVMVDDDLANWGVRISPDAGRYMRAKDDDILDAFKRLEQHLEVYAHAGLGPRFFANTKRNFEFNAKMVRVLGYRADIIRSHRLKFAPLVEDTDMTIQLFRAGYASVTDYGCVHDQVLDNAPGGCSEYRTIDMHNQITRLVACYHNDFIDVVEKKAGPQWGGASRLETRVKWAKLAKVCNPQPIASRVGSLLPRTRDI